MGLKLVLHFLKYPHALLVPVIYLREQREVVGGVLIKNIVFYYHHLQLFHVESGVHLDCAFVHQVYYLTLLLQLLRTVRQILSLGIADHGVGHCFRLRLLLFFVLVKDGLQYFL